MAGATARKAERMNQIGFSMVNIYQIGAILFVAVGVLGSALAIAWRDANRNHRRVTIRKD
jgi:hypothetical protein